MSESKNARKSSVSLAGGDDDDTQWLAVDLYRLALVRQLVIKCIGCIKHVDFFEFIELRVGEVDILVKL